MCKFAQYFHALCGHHSSAPFIYEKCSTECGFWIASAMQTRNEFQGPNNRVLRDIDLKRIVVMSACRYCFSDQHYTDPYNPRAVIPDLDQLLTHQQIEWHVRPVATRDVGISPDVHWNRPSTRQPESPPVSPTGGRIPFSFDDSARTVISVVESVSSELQSFSTTTSSLMPAPLRLRRQTHTVRLEKQSTLRAVDVPRSLVPAPLKLSPAPRANCFRPRISDTPRLQAAPPTHLLRPISEVALPSPEINHEDLSLIPQPLSLHSTRSSGPNSSDLDVDRSLIPLPLSIRSSRSNTPSSNLPGEFSRLLVEPVPTAATAAALPTWQRVEGWARSHLPVLTVLYVLFFLLCLGLFITPFNDQWSVYCSAYTDRCTWLNRWTGRP